MSPLFFSGLSEKSLRNLKALKKIEGTKDELITEESLSNYLSSRRMDKVEVERKKDKNSVVSRMARKHQKEQLKIIEAKRKLIEIQVEKQNANTISLEELKSFAYGYTFLVKEKLMGLIDSTAPLVDEIHMKNPNSPSISALYREMYVPFIEEINNVLLNGKEEIKKIIEGKKATD